jgi:hypothetical protein
MPRPTSIHRFRKWDAQGKEGKLRFASREALDTKIPLDSLSINTLVGFRLKLSPLNSGKEPSMKVLLYSAITIVGLAISSATASAQSASTKSPKPTARFAKCVHRGMTGTYTNGHPNDRATAEAWCHATATTSNISLR